MVIDVRTVPAGHSVVSQKTGLGAQKHDLPKLLGAISCRAEIERRGAVLYVHLWFEGICELECSRCCTPFQWPVSGDIRLVIQEGAERYGSATGENGIDFYYNSRHLDVDLGPVIYEEILTTLPLKPLCSEKCNGIQIANREEKYSGIDPRWEALAQLKKRY